MSGRKYLLLSLLSELGLALFDSLSHGSLCSLILFFLLGVLSHLLGFLRMRTELLNNKNKKKKKETKLLLK
jgi:uncharacterized membrane protein